MKKNILLLGIFLAIFTSCSTSKPVITDKNNKIKNKASDYYRETMEEAYENILKEKEKKELSNNKNLNLEDKENEEILVATSKVKVTKQVVLNYIEKYRAVAIDNMNNYNIPASITLAQGILESGCGTSTLSFSANNHFGIKCHTNWEGESVTHTDDAPDECFRKYKNPRDSFRDHSLFLTSRKWYEPLFELDIKDYKSWSYGLKKSGYATDSKYPQKLISIIERYKLHQYDNYYDINSNVSKEIEKTKTEPETEKNLEISNSQKNKVNESNDEISENINNSVKSETKKNIIKAPKTHIVTKGDTVYNISKKHNISIEKLKTLNNILENNISLGQLLIVE
jgi:flagellum-specific peptidoglycan hydrolase FlgJ